MKPLSDRLRAAYDPETFRRDGHRLIDHLADWLARAEARDDAPVLPWVEPDAARAAWPAELPEDGDGDVVGVLEQTIAGAIRLHHPRYLGHQVPPPVPGAALADLVAALLNNGMAVYEMGPTATPIEVAVIRWLATQLGMTDAADGVLTSGGSLGNLTALLAARNATGGDAVLCTAQAHYSIARATRTMGWGDAGAIPVAVDDRFRLRPDALDEAHARATAAGRRVAAVVASAASTGTGAFDPLDAVADWCAARGVWLHVDGAHGASAALSPRHRHLVGGIERADSVVWDLHKLMAMPALITAVIFRDGARSYAPFAQEASYLYAPGATEWWNLGLRTFECTKRMMSVIAYAALRGLGVATFRDYVERCFELGAALAARIEAAPDFELAVPPDGNIVCFRYLPAGERQAEVRRRVLERGRYYILQTALNGRTVLRVALMNPLIAAEDLDGMLDEVRAQG